MRVTIIDIKLIHIMKKYKSLLFSGLLVASTFMLLVTFAQYSIKPLNVEAQTNTPPTPPLDATPIVRLTGYAWSENIGWISFQDGSNPVIVSSDGTLTGSNNQPAGYAWSENIGWIQFGGLSGFPSAPGNTGGQARVVESPNGSTLTGWARAVAGGTLNSGGWDGWISLNGTATNGSSYATKLRAGTLPPVLSVSEFTPGCQNGCAWGSDVVGWVDFSGVKKMNQLNSCVGPNNTVIADGSSFAFYSTVNGQCLSEVRTCANGTLSGTYTSTVDCTVQPPANCVFNGKQINHGNSGVFYSKSISGKGQTCNDVKATLTCDDGNMVGAPSPLSASAFKFATCINNPSFIEN